MEFGVFGKTESKRLTPRRGTPSLFSALTNCARNRRRHRRFSRINIFHTHCNPLATATQSRTATASCSTSHEEEPIGYATFLSMKQMYLDILRTTRMGLSATKSSEARATIRAAVCACRLEPLRAARGGRAARSSIDQERHHTAGRPCSGWLPAL